MIYLSLNPKPSTLNTLNSLNPVSKSPKTSQPLPRHSVPRTVLSAQAGGLPMGHLDRSPKPLSVLEGGGVFFQRGKGIGISGLKQSCSCRTWNRGLKMQVWVETGTRRSSITETGWVLRERNGVKLLSHPSTSKATLTGSCGDYSDCWACSSCFNRKPA